MTDGKRAAYTEGFAGSRKASLIPAKPSPQSDR